MCYGSYLIDCTITVVSNQLATVSNYRFSRLPYASDLLGAEVHPDARGGGGRERAHGEREGHGWILLDLGKEQDPAIFRFQFEMKGWKEEWRGEEELEWGRRKRSG